MSDSSEAFLPKSHPCSPTQEQWFAEEVRPLEPALRAYLQRRYPTIRDVDDVVQESYLKTFLAWQRGRLTSVRGFLFTVAGNVTVSLFRKRKHVSSTPVSELPASRVVMDDADPIEALCSKEELALVAEAIATLPERCREVAVARLIHGQECREIAVNLAISPETVRVQLSRAMKKCAEYFEARGLTQEGRR